jgi:pimeloyl-ACP methyl ester carboxylesterase
MQVGVQYAMAQPTVWVVYTDSPDMNEELAAQTLIHEVTLAGCSVGVTSIEKLDVIPLFSDAIVVIGHGSPDGIETLGSVLPWADTNALLNKRNPQMLVYLSCYSPSEPVLNIFGFSGSIDAEAGALLAAWRILYQLMPTKANVDSLYQIPELQKAMLHPLESYVYFVHGYFGSNETFSIMRDVLADLNVSTRYSGFKEFSYWEPYWELMQGDFDTWADFMWEMHSGMTITDYANDFANALIDEHELEYGVQIDIVAHSLGGLITREMLRNWRISLGYYGIEIGRVITLGTPHNGTRLAENGLAITILDFLDLFYGLPSWASPVFSSVAPASPFLATLNQDPESYSTGIEWYTVSGICDYLDPMYALLLAVHYDTHDKIVATGRAHLSFAMQEVIPSCDHTMLVNDPESLSCQYISTWLQGGIDSDSDGLLDVEERHAYGTDPDDWDSDNDLLSDGMEVNTYGTNPNAWSTDGDILSDSQEIDWGYDPHDTDDPIDADYLTYSAWQRNGMGYVRANHYTAMDYVKVYVKYKNSYGQWTAYFYVGTDNTPYYYGDYYVEWSLLQGYVQMLVKVEAYDSAHHYLGCDTQYVTLFGGGSGGGGGGDPVPE